VVLAVTGVGKSRAAFAAGWILARAPCSAAVNIGCAGAFPGSQVRPGDVVIADREILADEGVETPEGFLGLEALGIGPRDGAGGIENRIPIHPPCRLSPKTLARLSRDLGFPIIAGPLCTVSTGSGTDRRSAEVLGRWRPLAESMEGAALAIASLLASVPFLEIRGISNWTGDRDRSAWDVPLAAARAAAVAARIIEGAPRWEPPVKCRPDEVDP